MNTEALLSLALLKVHSDNTGSDYYDYFVPFVTFVLTKYPQEQITSHETKAKLLAEFGLIIPAPVVEVILKRFAKRKYLTLANRVYTLVKTPPVPDIESRRVDARTRLDSLVTALMFFASVHNQLWTTDHTTAVLLKYVSQFSIDFLKGSGTTTVLPKAEHITERDLYITNAFVVEIHKSDTPAFDNLMLLVKGNMLANALTCPDIESVGRSFENLTFYLDTPVVLHLFNLEGEPRRDAANELLTLLRELKGTIAVFEHTVEEIYNVILACEQNLDKPHSKGRIIDAARSAGLNVSDLTLLRATLGGHLASLGIDRRPTPNYNKAVQIDESILEGTIDFEVQYMNPKALHFDINSVRSIYALRRNHRPRTLEEAEAVFVTTNSALAYAAHQFGRQHESTREVSSTITDFSLANIAWLKAPMRAPDLPRIEVIANCYAAMEPTEALWAKYLAELERLLNQGEITANDHALLRFEMRPREELMNLTLGSEEEFSPRTVTQILASVRAELDKEANDRIASAKSEGERQLAAARSEHEAALLSQQAQMKAELAAERADRLAAESRHSSELLRSAAARSRMEQVAKAVGKVSGLLVFAALVFVIVSSILFVPRFSQSTSQALLLGAAIVVVVAALLGFLNSVWGVSVRSIAATVDDFVKMRVLRLGLKYFVDIPTSTESNADSLHADAVPLLQPQGRGASEDQSEARSSGASSS